MGGGELPERMRIPHYSTYNYENINKFPELVKYQQDLAKQGLKDPWLRNVFWMYQTSPRYIDGKRTYLNVRRSGAFFQGFVAATAIFGVIALFDQARLRLGGGKKDDGHH